MMIYQALDLIPDPAAHRVKEEWSLGQILFLKGMLLV